MPTFRKIHSSVPLSALTSLLSPHLVKRSQLTIGLQHSALIHSWFGLQPIEISPIARLLQLRFFDSRQPSLQFSEFRGVETLAELRIARFPHLLLSVPLFHFISNGLQVWDFRDLLQLTCIESRHEALRKLFSLCKHSGFWRTNWVLLILANRAVIYVLDVPLKFFLKMNFELFNVFKA